MAAHQQNGFEELCTQIKTLCDATNGCDFERKNNSLVRILFEKEVAFSKVDLFYKASRQCTNESYQVDAFLSAEKSKILLCIRKTPKSNEPQKGQKRGIDDVVNTTQSKVEGATNTAVDENVFKLLDSLKKSNSYKEADAEMVQIALRRLGRLQGAHRERALQSFSAAFKKTDSDSSKLVFTASFNSGVLMKVGELKRALGDLWADGQLCIDLEVFKDMSPPLSNEGKTAAKFGNKPLLLMSGATAKKP